MVGIFVNVALNATSCESEGLGSSPISAEETYFSG